MGGRPVFDGRGQRLGSPCIGQQGAAKYQQDRMEILVMRTLERGERNALVLAELVTDQVFIDMVQAGGAGAWVIVSMVMQRHRHMGYMGRVLCVSRCRPLGQHAGIDSAAQHREQPYQQHHAAEAALCMCAGTKSHGLTFTS